MQTAVFSCHPRLAAAKGPASSLCAFGIPRAPATRGNDKQGFPHSNLTVPAKAETSHLRSRAIGLRYQFEQVTVGVIEIDATAAVEVINFARPLPHKVGVKHHAPVTEAGEDRKSTRLNSSHDQNSYAVFCLKKKKTTTLPATSSARSSNSTATSKCGIIR